MTVKTSGWGTFIPNKGYRKKVGTKHISFREEDKTKHEQFLNDGTENSVQAAAKLIAYCPFKADGSLFIRTGILSNDLVLRRKLWTAHFIVNPPTQK